MGRDGTRLPAAMDPQIVPAFCGRRGADATAKGPGPDLSRATPSIPSRDMDHRPSHFASRLPFYYGWLIVGIAFVTMAVGVTARTAFSLLMPPLIDEFGWDRGLAAGAFSFGFLVSAAVSPVLGRLIDRRGPRFVIEAGVVITAAGLAGATLISTPWQLYATLGLLVGIGANSMSYSVHSQFLPNWFLRN